MLPVAHVAEMDVRTATELKVTCAVGSQTETMMEEMDLLFQSTLQLLVENRQLIPSVSERAPFSCFTKGADVHFYTRLLSVKMLNCVFANVSTGFATHTAKNLPTSKKGLFLLVKLRLDGPMYDRACRNGITIWDPVEVYY